RPPGKRRTRGFPSFSVAPPSSGLSSGSGGCAVDILGPPRYAPNRFCPIAQRAEREKGNFRLGKGAWLALCEPAHHAALQSVLGQRCSTASCRSLRVDRVPF